MSDNFNPYAEWLGLQATETSPNHYQLLGINESIADPAAIASAADRAMTRVRACKPGPRAAVWAQLLDQISAAKTTLTDPTQRQHYSQQLTMTPTAAAVPAPVNPNLFPPTHNATLPAAAQQTAQQPAAVAIDPMAPVATSPQPVAPQAAAIPMAVPYLQTATPALAVPNPMAPITNAPMAPTIPQAMPNPMAPVAQPIPVAPSPMAPMQPVAMPVAAPIPMQSVPYASPATTAAPMLASQPIAAAQPQTLDGTPNLLKRKPTATALAHSKSGGLLGPILLGGGVGGLILVVVGVAVFLSNSEPKQASPSVTVPSASLPAGNGGVASTMPRRLDEIPVSERPQPSAPTSRQPEQTPIEPAPAMTPASETQIPNTPAPEPMPEPEPGPSREELRALAQALTTARAAIGERNFPVADREIAKALALAKLDEHKAKVSRLQMLSDYVARFRAAIGETLGRVSAGEQINFGDGKSFGIVEVAPDFLIIRVSGQNRRYPMTELPPGLATILAEMSLDKASLDTIAMKAAFVSIDPKVSDADLEKARSWWQEAASVRDVKDLIAAINDDYSLKQDVMAVPIEPNAMAELTARADRLKDARTIDEFAKEFQAAIDESLKTLEPAMELMVGGSTTVTIKEVKPDRVMLTVVDDMRGFQLTKLPLGLAASLAERILPRDAPLSMVMKGAYYAAREKDQSDKQFRPIVLDWWQQAAEMDQQLQPVIHELVKQYAE